MPLSSDPNSTVDFWLDSDSGKPEDSRPTFLCRHMGVGEHIRIRELQKKLKGLPMTDEGDDEWVKVLSEMISVGVVGWRNFDKPFSVQAIVDTLNAKELFELAIGYRYAVRLSEVDLKKSGSPSISTEPPVSAAADPKNVK